MVRTNVLLGVFLLVLQGLCIVTIKDSVYNITEDNFEEFIEMAKGKNSTFAIKFYTRIIPSL